MKDIAHLLTEGIEETPLKDYIKHIDDLEGIDTDEQRSLCLKLIAKISEDTWENNI